MLRIITDTASDITAEQAKEMGVDLVTLEIAFEDGLCPQETESDIEAFYEKLKTCKKLPVTSRPAPQAYLDLYLNAKEKGEEVLVLTISSGLSGTIESALLARDMAEYDAIHVVDTHQAILTQRMLVELAVQLREDGYDAKAIAEKICACRDLVTVCGVVDSLKYLQKGGRIPSSLAMIGRALNIKPVIILRDKKLSTLGKVRGYAAGEALLHKQMELDGVNKAYPVYFGYTSDRSLGEQFMQKTKEKYDIHQCRLHPVGGVIGTHCGTNCVAIAYMKLSADMVQGGD